LFGIGGIAVLYQVLLKDDFEKLPRALRVFHSAPGGGKASGIVTVRHSNPLLARLLRFPACGHDIPVRVQVVASHNQEIWIRHFGNSVRRSVQSRKGDLLLETIGPVRLFFRLLADHSGMRFEYRRARLWMIPVPFRVEATVRGIDLSWEIELTVNCVGSYFGRLRAQA
jgi:hypothetical protein